MIRKPIGFLLRLLLICMALAILWIDTATAQSDVQAVTGPYLGPFGIIDDQLSQFLPDQQYTLKFIDDWDEPDYFMTDDILIVDLGDGHYFDQIAGAAQNVVAIGDSLPSLRIYPGGFRNGILERLQPSAYQLDMNNPYYMIGDNFQQWEQDGRPLDARVVLIPVVHLADIDGRRECQVNGFSAFFTDYYDDSPYNGCNAVSLYFVSDTNPNVFEISEVPEPSSLLGILGAVGGFCFMYRRRLKS